MIWLKKLRKILGSVDSYFKPEHLEKFPNVHDLFWNATKKAGEAKKTEDPAVGEELLSLINEIDEVFQATKS